MHDTKMFLILIAQLIFTSTAVQKGPNDGDLLEKIKSLEKTKSELLVKINQAINESVRSLQGVNATEAQEVRAQIAALEQQVKILQNPDTMQQEGFNDTRRKLKQFNTDLKEVYKHVKKGDSKYKHALKVQKQIQEWAEKRMKEKALIDEYKKKKKVSAMKTEKCPHYGIGSPKTFDKNRPPDVWPCCRKCCKRSYLGCL